MHLYEVQKSSLAVGTSQVQGLFTCVRLDNVKRHGYEVSKLNMAGCTTKVQGLFTCVRLDNEDRH